MVPDSNAAGAVTREYPLPGSSVLALYFRRLRTHGGYSLVAQRAPGWRRL